MLIPYHVDVPMARVPIANFVLIGITSLISLYLLTLPDEIKVIDLSSLRSQEIRLPNKVWESFLLNGGRASGGVLHLFAHADFFHLAGNMLFLWVFGNAVCAKVGNLLYPLLYLALGLAAAVVHSLFRGGPAVGASGAINGIVGMYVVWYALNEISCLFYFYGGGGTLNLSSFWLILLFLAFDIWGAASGKGAVGYAAHLGGFFAGFGLAWILMGTGAVKMEEGEKSLADLFRGGE